MPLPALAMELLEEIERSGEFVFVVRASTSSAASRSASTLRRPLGVAFARPSTHAATGMARAGADLQ